MATSTRGLRSRGKGRRAPASARTRASAGKSAGRKRETVGVIGLGIMGSAMSANLVRGGYRVVGYDPLPEAARQLKKAGGEPRYTEYPFVGHNSWDSAYVTPELYPWLLSHKLK